MMNEIKSQNTTSTVPNETINQQPVEQVQTLQLQQPKKKGKKVALIVILCIVSTVLMLIILGVLIGFFSSKSSSSTTAQSGAVQAEQTTAQTDGAIGKYVCTVKSAILTTDYSGKDVVKITYEFTNNSNKKTCFVSALDDEVYQNGVQLKAAYILEDYDVDDGAYSQIKTGATIEVTKAYYLNDKTTNLDVEISRSFSRDVLTYEILLE